MRVLIFAPNAGVSLSTGGGTNFVLKQADILSELGHEVTIAGYHALTPTELELIHGIPLLHRSPNQPIRVIGSISDAAFNVARESRGKISPYFVLLDPRFGRWMRRVVTMVDPQLVWFHDDIPKAVVPSLGNRRVIVYVHYPLEARNTGTPKLANNMVTTSERIIRRSLTCLSPKIVSPLSSDFIEMVWANSSVTRRVLGQFLGVKAEYIPTYIDPVQSVCAGELKLDRVLSIGAFQRAKEQELLIRALAVPAAHGYRTTIDLVGNMRDSAYLEELKGEAKKGDGALVKFHVDAPRKELEETLRESSVYVHCAEFEPFG
ncbi:MAG: glycosyltransferase, partial [Nitrososphaerota archaeon]|nr:glycosyltransferase [Nitrososphaerota archaeon]